MPMAVLPGAGERVDIKSTKGLLVYRDCEVIGVGDSRRGRALWLWVDGEMAGRPGRVHACMPLDEIDFWSVR